jgi:hypothetical protein
MVLGLTVIGAPITVLETAASPHPSIWSNTAFLICLAVGVLALAAGAWILMAFFLPLPLPKTRHEREAFKDLAERVALGQARSALPPPPPEDPTGAMETSHLVFDEAPPELADMSPASLKELFAGRTEAQSSKLLEQHIGKSVRVSGEVTKVEFAAFTTSVSLHAAVNLLLFFDKDAEPQLLVLNLGDEVAVSGQIQKFPTETMISLEKCKLIEARGRRS